MGTTAIAYKEKYFWVHDATGEVFAAILLEELNKHPDKMVVLRAEIEELLPHWVVGILVSLKDYLQTEENIQIFLQAIHRSLELARLSSDELCISGFSVGKDVFFEEISAFKQLITEYDTFNKNAKIYASLSQKWIMA